MDEATKKAIKKDWDNGAFSPLQLSYKHKVEIEEVYEAIEQAEMNEVDIVGDQVDNAGPGVQISRGSKAKAIYTKN